jgi:hypothetical protein
MGPSQHLTWALATAVFIGLTTAIAKATGQAYVPFPELGALALGIHDWASARELSS